MDQYQRKIRFPLKGYISKARVSNELIFGNRIRNTLGVLKCIKVKEDGLGKEECRDG